MKILDSYKRLNRDGFIKNPYPNVKDNKTLMKIIKGNVAIDKLAEDEEKKEMACGRPKKECDGGHNHE